MHSNGWTTSNRIPSFFFYFSICLDPDLPKSFGRLPFLEQNKKIGKKKERNSSIHGRIY
jgi:hypothetical protein